MSRILGAFVLMSFALAALAQQYRWIDDKGRVQYTDTPPPVGAKDVKKKNLNAAAAGPVADPYALQVAVKNAPVRLFSTQDCGPGCSDARKLLNGRGVPFSEVSVSTEAQLEEVKTLSGGTLVPVMVVGTSVQKGFHEQGYHRALDVAGYPAAGALKARNQAAPEKPPAVQPAKAVAK
jgi:hypothetical protein